MKHTLSLSSAIAAGFVAALLWTSPAGAAWPTGWPATKTVNGTEAVYHEPQVDTWDQYRKITAHMAVSITKAGSKPTMGTIAITADTLVDFDKRAVQLSNVKLGDVNFPLLSADDTKKLTAWVQANAKLDDTVLPLDTILLNMQQTKTLTRKVNINTAPPKIYYSTKPAILVAFEGDPIFAPIKGLENTDLQVAINTNWDMFKTANTYYLRAGSYWLQSSAAIGPWMPAGALPDVFNQLPADDNFKDARANLNAKAIPAAQMPTVWVATQAAEAIVVGGNPKLVTIAGTKLQSVDNSDANIFFYPSEKKWFYMTSGRWYRAAKLGGPWEFASILPLEFSKIPADGQFGWLLPSIPGTPQAREAVLESQVPRETRIDRSQAKLDVKYAGDPQWEQIKGTSLQRAVNTTFHVIKVGDPAYYAIQDGVWFSSDSPDGPWVVADSVPEEIYTIPPESDLYQDTYVTVQQSDPSYVWYGYGAGYYSNYPCYWPYYGMCYGTGWWGYPWYGYYGGYPWYRPWPATFTAGVWWNPATGGYGRGWGVRGPYGGAVAGGGYHGASGAFWRGGAVYGPNGGMGGFAFYNPNTGNWFRGGVSWGAGGVNRWGQGGNVNNRPTPYSSWGNAARPVSINQPGQLPAGGANRPSTGAGGAQRPSTGAIGGGGAQRPSTGAIGAGARPADNVFSGRDGNVYRQGTNGSWQQFNNKAGSWQPTVTGGAGASAGAGGAAARPSQPVSAQTYQGLNNASAARSYGASNFGGGGFRGGGGGFRGGGRGR